MSPSWYDLLGLDPSASDAEVRAAWKATIADLEPTDRRFRLANQAAEVLLDPDRRAAYDAELAAEAEPIEEPAEAPAEEPVDEPGEVVGEPAAPVVVTASSGSSRSGWVVPAWLLVLVAVLAAGMLVVTALLLRESSDDAVDDAIRSAQAAAERAVPPVLSYDAADLEASRSAAASYLTPSYQKERDELFDEVIDANAPNTGTKVSTSVVESSIVRGTSEDRVEVFLLIDQSTTNKTQTEPLITRTWVTMTMEKDDGDWLVADMTVV